MPGHGNTSTAAKMPSRSAGYTPEQKLLPLLSGVVEDGNGKWKACCPIHEADGGNHDPSLHITKGADGKLLLHCFVCGDDVKAAQFCYAVGLTMSDLYPEHGPAGVKTRKASAKSYKGAKKEGSYIYRDEQGAIVCKVEKWRMPDGSKEFPTYRPNGEGGWLVGIKGIKRVLYRLPDLIASKKEEVVYIVEGEKKADALSAWGLIATSCIGGAGKWNKEYAKWFIGRTVVILPDNDSINPKTGRIQGLDHANDVLKALKPVAEMVRVLILPDLPPKGDIVDWQAAGGTLPKFLELVRELTAGPQTDAEKQLEQAEKGKSDELDQITQLDPLDLRLPEAMTDLANGRRLIQMHGKNIRWCQPWKRWIVWDGKRWKQDDSLEVERMANSVADWLWDEMRRIGRDIGDNLFVKVCNYVKHSSNRTPIEKMMSSARGLPECKIMPDQFDPNRWLLNCQNGTVDLQTGVLQPHSQSDMITQISPTVFDPEAQCPTWQAFLLSIFGSQEMVDYVQRLCGYWATGVVREQSLPILWGVGSNGKTTFLNAVMEVLGTDYTMKAPSDFLMVKKERHLTEKADLFGKRFVVCSETSDGRQLDEALVKELTGNERLRVRRLYENLWEFDPTHKIALVTNHMPQIRGTDHGMWRRIRKISFTNQFWNPDLGETGEPQFMQDKFLGEKIKAEYSGILTWIVKGCIQWNHDGEQAPTAVTDCTTEYRQSQDVLGAFIEDCCQVGMGCLVMAKDLYKAYEKWAEDNGERPMSGRTFGLRMTDRKFHRFTSNGTWYSGIELLANSSSGSDY